MPKIGPKLASKPTMTATATPDHTTSSPPHPAPAPATTTTLTSEPTWLTGPALKAVNEHTYATQRAKKAADRAKGKLPPRKLPNSTGGGGGGSVSFSSSSSASRGAAITSFWAEVWDARKMMSAEDLDWPELPTPLSKWAPSPAAEYAAPLRPTQDREVPLSALARPVKARGAKAKAKEGEFEFLPPVKNVIVLDDTESNVPDEPWEYISSVGGDDEARKIFSYAEIVSKSA